MLTLDNGHDGTLLDGRRALETVGVDTTQKLGLQVHGIEAVGRLIVVGLDLGCVRNLVSRVGSVVTCAMPLSRSCNKWLKTQFRKTHNQAEESTHSPRYPQVLCPP